MRKFVADSRTLPEFGELSLVVSSDKKISRKNKKKIKEMAKRVSTLEILDYILGSEDE